MRNTTDEGIGVLREILGAMLLAAIMLLCLGVKETGALTAAPQYLFSRAQIGETVIWFAIFFVVQFVAYRIVTKFTDRRRR